MKIQYKNYSFGKCFGKNTRGLNVEIFFTLVEFKVGCEVYLYFTLQNCVTSYRKTVLTPQQDAEN